MFSVNIIHVNIIHVNVLVYANLFFDIIINQNENI